MLDENAGRRDRLLEGDCDYQECVWITDVLSMDPGPLLHGVSDDAET